MIHAPNWRRATWSILAGWAGFSAGCTHNYYYGALPACGPGTPTVASQVGPVCAVPGQVPAVVGSSGGTSSNVTTSAPAAASGSGSGTSTPPKVVVSQPTFSSTIGTSLGQAASRLNWRRPDPDGVATVRAEGGIDDSSIQR